MLALYRSADCLLLPSRAEGLPRTVLEASASGVPAVTSHLGQTADIVNTVGVTVAVGDVDGYAAALQSVLAAGDLGADGRELVPDEHRWVDTIDRITSRLAALI